MVSETRQLKHFANHRRTLLACVEQGLLHLAINFPDNVWKGFRSWMHTLSLKAVPSEHVVAEPLRQDLPDYLLRARGGRLLREVTCEDIDPDIAPRWITPERLAA